MILCKIAEFGFDFFGAFHAPRQSKNESAQREHFSVQLVKAVLIHLVTVRPRRSGVESARSRDAA